MKKETLKEIGKLIYDFAKIGGAIVLITPFAKGEDVSLLAVASIFIAIGIGTYIINKGVKDG